MQEGHIPSRDTKARFMRNWALWHLFRAHAILALKLDIFKICIETFHENLGYFFTQLSRKTVTHQNRFGISIRY